MTDGYGTQKAADEAWNKRAKADCHDELVAACEMAKEDIAQLSTTYKPEYLTKILAKAKNL